MNWGSFKFALTKDDDKNIVQLSYLLINLVKNMAFRVCIIPSWYPFLMRPLVLSAHKEVEEHNSPALPDTMCLYYHLRRS